MRGDSTTSRVEVGFAGLDSCVSLATHNDHNSQEGNVPPINRGLETRLGVENRRAAITLQGGAAVLAAWKATRKTPSPKRVAGRIDSRPYDPSKGGAEDRGDNTTQTLWLIQESIRESALEGRRHDANSTADAAIKAHPEWEVAIRATMDHWFRGGRSPQEEQSEE